MTDSTGETEYTCTSVFTCRDDSGEGDTVACEYDGAANLSVITHLNGTKVSYEYDKNDRLVNVTDHEGFETTYKSTDQTTPAPITLTTHAIR